MDSRVELTDKQLLNLVLCNYPEELEGFEIISFSEINSYIFEYAVTEEINDIKYYITSPMKEENDILIKFKEKLTKERIPKPDIFYEIGFWYYMTRKIDRILTIGFTNYLIDKKSFVNFIELYYNIIKDFRINPTKTFGEVWKLDYLKSNCSN